MAQTTFHSCKVEAPNTKLRGGGNLTVPAISRSSGCAFRALRRLRASFSQGWLIHDESHLPLLQDTKPHASTSDGS
ncbi:hypothetical protein SORBI_3003G193300 [Sorghum bicolor]|uniref:Uncharacterized protein n=1 Tax=Sorghum bicolor TaxID=4558 RepID=A0A1B6Q4B3_SORBI|nr:hypothetical protein SORBI_3003G193300 [Sorghum bicolor]